MLADVGLNIDIGNSDYSFDSTITISGAANSLGNVTGKAETVVGVSVGFGWAYRFSERWGLFSTIRYRYLDSIELRANGMRVKLDLGESFLLNLGALYRF